MPRYNLDQAIEQLRKADPRGFKALNETMQALVSEHGASAVEYVLEKMQRDAAENGIAI